MSWEMVISMLGSGGLVAFVDWFIRLKVIRRKSKLDRDDILRLIVERETAFANKLHENNIETLKRLSYLEELLFQLVRCKYYYTCPVRHKLQEYRANLQYQRNRQPDLEQKGFRFPRDNPSESGAADDSDGQPP